MPPSPSAPPERPATTRNLKDELASLRIEREPKRQVSFGGSRKRGRNLGMRLLGALIWLIPLSILSGIAYFAYDQYTKFRPKAEVQVGVVQSLTSGEAEKLLSAKGYMESRYQAMIGAKMPGRVEQMLVEEGSKVTQGQLLAVLEHKDMLEMLRMRKATQSRTEAEIQELDVDIEDLNRKYQRQSRLLARDSAAAQEAENAYFAHKKAQARRVQLVASLEMQKAAIGEIEQNVENMKVYAPFDGTVIEKAAEVGETITPGGMGAASGRGSVVTLANLSKLEVDTDVAEGLLSKVAIGQPAEVSVSAVPGKRYRGRLRSIIPMGDRAKGTVKVKVEILDPDDKLFPELVATVHFLPDKRTAAVDAATSFLFVPKAAVIESVGRFYVWVVENQSGRHILTRKEVEVLATNDELARVEKGLKSGEQVVINPDANLHEGEYVRIAE